jgi:hypothetical protein
MDTELLIERLSSDVSRVRPVALSATITAGIVAGGLASALLLFSAMGLRADLAGAVRSGAFWIKLAYAASLAAITIVATIRLGRPEARGIGRLWPMLLPVVVLCSVGIAELLRTPSAMWPEMWLGKSWAVCPWRILALALPAFAGMLWSLRRLAPTDLRSAGAAAGLASGALGAMIYCLRCPETSAIFVLTWYGVGIALAGGLGALLGPKLLRW